MESISFGDAEGHFGELIEKAEAGETITITRDGEPVVSLVPTLKKIDGLEADADTAQAARPRKRIDVDALRALTFKMKPAKMSAVDIVREMRDSRY